MNKLHKEFWNNFNMEPKTINTTLFQKILNAAWRAKLDMNFDSGSPDSEELFELRNMNYTEAVLTYLSKLDNSWPCYYEFKQELKNIQ